MQRVRFKVGYLVSVVLLALFSSFAYANRDASIPVIKDLQQFSKIAEDRNVPILIMFSMDDCTFCKLIRSEYLSPLQNRDEEAKQILIGEISIESYNYVRDFNGQLISADNLGLRYSADLSPTIVFVDAKGNELVERMVGFKGRDYYDLELANAIRQSIKKLSQ